MNNQTQQAKNWQEIIDNLLKFSEIERNAPPNYANAFLQTAEQLQALESNNGTEAEKEAFFSNVQDAYMNYEQASLAIEEAKKQKAEDDRIEQEKQEKMDAYRKKWHETPFYARDKFSDVLCIETRKTLEDKLFAISCMLDNLKVIPNMLEMETSENCPSGFMDRLAEMSKLYILFTEEQFTLLLKDIQGDLC